MLSMLLVQQLLAGRVAMARDVALIYVIASILFCAGTTMIISMVP